MHPRCLGQEGVANLRFYGLRVLPYTIPGRRPRQDLNLRPTVPQTVALSTELRGLTIYFCGGFGGGF